jgi:hypothetical protein
VIEGGEFPVIVGRVPSLTPCKALLDGVFAVWTLKPYPLCGFEWGQSGA